MSMHNVTIDRNWRILRLLEVWQIFWCIFWQIFFDEFFDDFFTFLFYDFFPIFIMNFLWIFLRIFFNNFFLTNFWWIFLYHSNWGSYKTIGTNYWTIINSIKPRKMKKTALLCQQKKMVTFILWQPKKANCPSKES